MNFKNKKEYREQRANLINEANKANGNGELDKASELVAKIENLDKEFERFAQVQANLNALDNKQTPAPLPLAGNAGENNEEPTNIFASVEYRKAFMNFVQHGTEIPAKFSNEVTTSSTAGSIVPTTLYEQIITKLENYGTFYAKVFRTNYESAIAFPTLAVKPVASWVDEDKGADKQKIETSKITFMAHKLNCKVSFSLFMQVTSLEIFESQFTDLMAQAMVKMIDKAIINGTGAGCPKGILTETTSKVVNVTKAGKLDYKTLISAETLVEDVYSESAEYIMTRATFFQFLGMTDSNGQPIARVNLGLDGKPQFQLLGRNVNTISEDAIKSYTDSPASDITFAAIFDFKDYVFNEALSLTTNIYIDNDTHNKVLDMVMLADGKAVRTDSLVKLVKKSA